MSSALAERLDSALATIDERDNSRPYSPEDIATALDRAASITNPENGGAGISARLLRRFRSVSVPFARAWEASRAAAADVAADAARRWLTDCNPEAGDPRTASARVSLAQYRAAHDRWLAGCLDRATYGDAVTVDANVKVAAIVAFVDSAGTGAAREAVEAQAEVAKPGAQPSAYDLDRSRVRVK